MSSIKSDDKKYSLYLASQFIVVATILYAFLPPLASNNIVAISYSLLVVGSQSALFCVIAFLLSLIISKTLKKIFFIVKGSPVNSTPFIIWLIFSLLALLLLADLKLYLLYGYHINGFVINLALTKGGIESLGSSNSTLFTFTIFGFSVFLIQLVIYYLFTLAEKKNIIPAGRKTIIALSVLLTITVLTDKALYGYFNFNRTRPMLIIAHSLPSYFPVTYKKKLEALGFKRASKLDHENSALSIIDPTYSALNYPLQPIKLKKVIPLNIVWLTAESLRSDMLTPEIMPNTWKFSTERGINFTKHYSGGNGTRMGMFTQFYGLPGRYWFDFMDEQKPPVLLTALQEKQYDIKIYSGAKFSYPEFDKTIFSTIRNENMQDNTNKQLGETGWEADRRNTTDLINSLKNIENEKNFMRFQFFESAHARYYFPEDSIIRDDYLKSVNYATMSMEKDMPQIFNRYINSVHHLDQQIGKILNHLTSTGLIDNTIVIITGDHGEEFMENGHWGHNSEFTNEQTQVPLVISIPNEQPRQVNRLTSHSDLPATLLPLLGVINSPADYSTGNDLLSDKQSDFITITDWNRICIVKNNMKIYHAIDTKAWFSNRITTIDDKPIIESDSPTSKTHFGLLKSAQHQLLSFKAVKH